MATEVQFETLRQRRERSATRHRRVAFTAVSSVLSKVVVLATTLITVPITLNYLGAERYGLWMTITSLVLFLTAADLGLGNGLTITLAEADGKSDEDLARRAISSVSFALALIGIVIIAMLVTFSALVPWYRLYNAVSPLARVEARQATEVLCVCTALGLPIGIVSRVQLGFQKGYISDLWICAGNAAALLAIIFFVKSHHGLPWLVLAIAGCPLAATAINWGVEFFWTSPSLKPRIALIELDTTRRLIGLGAMFFVQQCFGLMYYLSDNLLIAHELGNREVATFAVVQRLFSIGLLSQYIMLPLWPAFREAIARGDYGWARTTLRQVSLLNVSIGGGGGGLLLISSRWLLRRWAHINVAGIDSLRVGFVFWIVLVGYIAMMNAFLNQPGVMKKYLFIFGGATLLAVSLKVVMVAKWGPAGAVWASVIAYGTAFVIPSYRLAAKWINAEAPACA